MMSPACKLDLRAMVDKDIKLYDWPRVGAAPTPPAADGFHIIVSGEAS